MALRDNLLYSSPWFKKALNGTNGKPIRVLRFPEDDFPGWLLFLRWTNHGDIPEIDRYWKSPDNKSDEKKIKRREDIDNVDEKEKKYREKYPRPQDRNFGWDYKGREEVVEKIAGHVSLYIIADNFNIEELKDLAIDRIRRLRQLFSGEYLAWLTIKPHVMGTICNRVEEGTELYNLVMDIAVLDWFTAKLSAGSRVDWMEACRDASPDFEDSFTHQMFKNKIDHECLYLDVCPCFQIYDPLQHDRRTIGPQLHNRQSTDSAKPNDGAQANSS